MANSKLIRRGTLILGLIALAASVLALAMVIYYYQGVIVATVTTSPLVFFIGPDGYAPPYVTTSVYPTGFTLTMQITNASYAYYYQVVGVNVYTWCWLYLVNVTTSSELISNLWLYISTPQNQTYCVLPVISSGVPVYTTYQSCTIGYWKTHATVPPWSSEYPPNATLGSVFTAVNTMCPLLSNYTLLEALYFPSQGPYNETTNPYCFDVELLLAQAVAALENSLTMHYPLTTSQVINMTNSAILSNSTTTVMNLQSYFTQLNEEYDYACMPGTYTSIPVTPGCTLQPGTYYISVLAQPITPLYIGQNETISFYLACNVISNVSVPLPPISSSG